MDTKEAVSQEDKDVKVGYTSILNSCLQDKNLSLKAKGLLCYMLSLPSDWNYSINGIVACSKEQRTTIRSAMDELKKHEYLKIDKTKDENGRYVYKYQIKGKYIKK